MRRCTCVGAVIFSITSLAPLRPLEISSALPVGGDENNSSKLFFPLEVRSISEASDSNVGNAAGGNAVSNYVSVIH